MSVSDVQLAAGDLAPDFTLPDQDGTARSLADFRGEKAILFVYPAANTPGCTLQACDFRDSLGPLADAGYRVLGLSKDALPALQKFRDNQGLSYPLLSDPGLETHRAYGVWGPKKLYGKIIEGTRRSTFVIDEEGRITHALYNVKATGHVARIRKLLGVEAAA